LTTNCMMASPKITVCSFDLEQKGGHHSRPSNRFIFSELPWRPGT
jgi:hypothetical protein